MLLQIDHHNWPVPIWKRWRSFIKRNRLHYRWRRKVVGTLGLARQEGLMIFRKIAGWCYILVLMLLFLMDRTFFWTIPTRSYASPVAASAFPAKPSVSCNAITNCSTSDISSIVGTSTSSLSTCSSVTSNKKSYVGDGCVVITYHRRDVVTPVSYLI